MATASNDIGPNAPSWDGDMRQTVTQITAAHQTVGGLSLVVAITNSPIPAVIGSSGQVNLEYNEYEDECYEAFKFVQARIFDRRGWEHT